MADPLEAFAASLFTSAATNIASESVTLQPADASGDVIMQGVFVSSDGLEVGDVMDGLRRVRNASLFVAYDAVNGTAVITMADKFVVRGERWNIESLGEKDGGCWNIVLNRPQQIETTVGGIRRNSQ